MSAVCPCAAVFALSRPHPLGPPAGWLVCLWPTLSALWIAADGFPGWHPLIVFVLGTILMQRGLLRERRADRDFDKHVKTHGAAPGDHRARSPSKKPWAWARCWPSVSFGPGAHHQHGGRPVVGARRAGGHCLPVHQTPIAMPQAVLGIAFNFGIVIAFAAEGAYPQWRGGCGWATCSGCWLLRHRIRHEWTATMTSRHQDLAITLGRLDVAGISCSICCFWHLGGSACPWRARCYFYVAMAAALAQAVWHFTLIRTRTREGCFKAFRINHWLGATVFAGIAGSYLLRSLLTN